MKEFKPWSSSVGSDHSTNFRSVTRFEFLVTSGAILKYITFEVKAY